MRTNTYSTETLVKLFKKEKVVTFKQVKIALGTDVKMTAIRKLKTLNYNVSYSHTGKYYTLDTIAKYNKLGLWEFKKVYFSKFGTLKNTIENLVCLSQEGYSSTELKQALSTEVQKPLFNLYSTGCLYREQIGNVYHYFSPQSYDLQKRNRLIKIDSLIKDKIPEVSIFAAPEIKKSFDVLLSNLNEKQRRLYLGFESLKLGYGGDTIISRITGVNIKTIARGRKELTLLDITPDSIRNAGGGRHPIKKNEIIKMLQKIMDNDTAGDPMSLKKWSRKSLRKLADQIREKDIQISINTTAKLLKELNFSLKSNRKEIAETQHPDRNQQFEIIGQLKEKFKKLNNPYISVDCKKKEAVGNFKNNGKVWSREFKPVYTHDFRSLAEGIANPYGIYEPLINNGTVVVGTSSDTPEFSVESIVLWLTNYGFKNYDNLSQLLIFCDCGGSNNYRARAWKYGIYKKICQPFEMSITVCHYPAGASKWNPIEHRLFSFISLNWAGVPLRNYETILNYISTTTTKQGLKVNAMLNNKTYEKGIKITDKQMKEIKIEKNQTLPQWNYTIYN